jgi:uncharacterized protein (TIGR02271 family)
VSWTTESSQIMTGDEVYGSDGDKVGTVAEVQPSYIVVEKGFFFPTDYYIPMSAIASVAGGQVYLNVAKDAALQSGWDTVPDAVSAATPGTETILTEGDRRTIDEAVIADDRLAAARVATDEEIRIPVIEEELTATVRPQEAGAVRIEKRVVAEDRVLEVPVTEERIRVERRVVDRPADTTDIGAFEETVIDVPLRSETVDLEKQARVAEEVVVSKEAVQRTEQARGTVRREEVFVDEDAIVDASKIDRSAEGSSRPL